MTRLTSILARAVLVIALALGASVAYAAPVSAGVLVASTSADPSPTIHVDAALLVFLAGSLMPLLTALLTKLDASSKVKAILNLVLSIAAGVLAAFIAAGDAGLSVLQMLTAGITAYLSSQVTYSGLWRPTGTTARIGTSTSGFGLGGTT